MSGSSSIPLAVDGYIRVSKVGGRAGRRFISPALQREQIHAWATSARRARAGGVRGARRVRRAGGPAAAAGGDRARRGRRLAGAGGGGARPLRALAGRQPGADRPHPGRRRDVRGGAERARPDDRHRPAGAAADALAGRVRPRPDPVELGRGARARDRARRAPGTQAADRLPAACSPGGCARTR